MSRKDIETVCTLAAHLAIKNNTGEFPPFGFGAPRCAADAMRLQRLGRRARNMETKRCNVANYYRESGPGWADKDCPYGKEEQRIGSAAVEILKPYGLHATVGGDPRGYCLHILGLPGNTMGGGNSSGFGI